jgi:hypothetical protein
MDTINNISTLLDNLVIARVKEYNLDKQGKPFESKDQKDIVSKTKNDLYTLLESVFNTNSFKEQNILDDVETLIVNDLDVGDAYYTKTDGEPTLEKFMVNEARLRKANESRGRMKNSIDQKFNDVINK